MDETFLFAKDPYEAKNQSLINKRKSEGLKHFDNFKASIEYLSNREYASIEYLSNIYQNIEDYNPNKKREILIYFDDMAADMLSNKKPNPIVTELEAEN